MSGHFTQRTRQKIIVRDEGRCQWCGRQIFVIVDGKPATVLLFEYSLQHRMPRGNGGTSGARAVAVARADNGVLVCGTGTTICHGHIESHRDEAKARGFGINTLAALSQIGATPIVDSTGRSWLLLPDGARA